MKLRMFVLFVIFAAAALLPYAAQQTTSPQTPTQSQAPATSPVTGKDLPDRSCTCCDQAKTAPDHQAQTCCHNRDTASMSRCHQDGRDPKAAMNCCNSQDAKASAARIGKSCGGSGADKLCCKTNDVKSCCGKDPMACNSKDSKGCCAGAEPCCVSAHGR